MGDNEILEKIVSLAVAHWIGNFSGISGLEIASRTGLPNEVIMKYMEDLASVGKGTLNSNVELYSISIDPENPRFERSNNPTTTHVFFPGKELLTECFYSSDLVRKKLPEYKARLYQGAHQLELVYFSDEVLARYFDHPEFYKIDDSLCGGTVLSKNEAPANRSLHIRYGRRRQADGRLAVAAIYKDLSAMSAEEQRYWHANEIEEFSPQRNDTNFLRFIERDFEGALVEYPSPIKNIQIALGRANDLFGDTPLFNRVKNSHLRLPVENTYKSLCDCCSEMYKLVGPDSLNEKTMKNFLTEKLGANNLELIHRSKKTLSKIELLALIESKMRCEGHLTAAIKKIGMLRIKADHEIINEEAKNDNHVDTFLSICGQLTEGLNYLCQYSKNKVNST
jgi:hypothetical protein